MSQAEESKYFMEVSGGGERESQVSILQPAELSMESGLPTEPLVDMPENNQYSSSIPVMSASLFDTEENKQQIDTGGYNPVEEPRDDNYNSSMHRNIDYHSHSIPRNIETNSK